MVVTADSLASAAGLEMLRAGGNAVDAAVAVHFTLAVTHPRAGNVGGGGFMVYRGADGDEAALDFREEAPSGATEDMFLDQEGEVTDESWTGPLAAGVPGSVAGMAEAHRRFGSLPWSRLLQPAIRAAEKGYRMDSADHEMIAGEAPRLRRFPSSAEKWLPGGEPPPVGSVFRQPDLARTLRTVADSGARAFYRGWIADSLAAEMEREAGLITRADLEAYEAVWRDPVTFDYRGRRIVSMPPPSSGGVTLAEIFNIVEGYRLDSLGFGSADAVHVTVEAFRRAFADRNYYLGDPDFVDMPLDRLTGQPYADSLRGTIRMDSASDSDEFTRVPMAGESTETTHYSIVDSAGTAVTVTTTLNGFLGSAVTVRGAGFVLNNEMDDFTAKPGVPNYYGLVQGEANAVRPGKRMLSAMTPALIVDRDGETRLATGTPGGSTIITTVFQVVSNMVDHGMAPQAAVNAPRVHHQHLPDLVEYERGGLRPEVVAELRRRGHDLEERGGHSGRVQSVWIGPDGLRVGASDPRTEGQALGR
jgi:gamma-glutamyltranspeptidase/glutathione hydrolase